MVLTSIVLTLPQFHSFAQPRIRTRHYAGNYAPNQISRWKAARRRPTGRARRPSLHLGRRPHPHLSEDFAGRFGARANAVGDADAVITIARQRQAGKFLAEQFD